MLNPNWAKAYPELSVTGNYRVTDEDFFVSELTNRVLSHEGPHWYGLIEKQGTNTHWLARQLANHAQCNLKDVGYAGLKDRHAVTRQWFSLPCKIGQPPNLTHLFANPEFKLLAHGFYGAKLKRGALGGNQFRLTIRNIEGDQSQIDRRIELIKQRGVPNYFGEQRFGHNMNNIDHAQRLFESGKKPRNRQKASMYISAARSFIFNETLSYRVENSCWDRPLDGEVWGFPGSLRGFADDGDSATLLRWRKNEIHPTAALWGRGQLTSTAKLQSLEESIANRTPLLCEGLEKAGLKQERRATRLMVPDLYSKWLDDSTLALHFSLPSGYYATSVLRELGQFTEAERPREGESVTEGGAE